MSEHLPSKELRKPGNWFVVLYFGIPIVVAIGACVVGIVKFMAWWRVAFGDCNL